MAIFYSVNISGFGLSDALDSAESGVAFDEISRDKCLHVHVQANLPANVTSLEGRYRKVDDDGIGDPAHDHDLGECKKIREGQYEFVLMHYVLDPNSTYLIRVADTFRGDTTCLGSSVVKTTAL